MPRKAALLGDQYHRHHLAEILRGYRELVDKVAPEGHTQPLTKRDRAFIDDLFEELGGTGND
jgi:hypothetical protein